MELIAMGCGVLGVAVGLVLGERRGRAALRREIESGWRAAAPQVRAAHLEILHSRALGARTENAIDVLS